MSRGVSSADVAPTLTPSLGMASSVTAERSYVQPAVSCVPDEPVRATNIVLSGQSSGGQFCPDRNLMCVSRVSNAVCSGAWQWWRYRATRL